MAIEDELKSIEVEIGLIITARIQKFISLINSQLFGKTSFTRIQNDLPSLIRFKKRIPRLYREAGLDTLTKDIADRFPDVAKETIEDTAKRLGVETLRAGAFTESGRAILKRTLRGVRKAELLNNRRFRQILKLKTIKDLNVKEFKSLIAGTAAKTRGQLQTEASTAVQAFDNAVATVKGVAAGAKSFRYSGPKGGPIREFCAERVGQIFTVEESLLWNNGQISPAFIYLGGYNCRHRKTFILAEEIEV